MRDIASIIHGKDIPLEIVREVVIPQIVELIAKEYNVSPEQALDMFYTSRIGKVYGNDQSGLYGDSPLHVFALFKEEYEGRES